MAYGSQTYLAELADELKREGVIDQHSTIQHVDDLLSAVANASSTTASAFNTPPLSVEGLKQTVRETRRITEHDRSRVASFPRPKSHGCGRKCAPWHSARTSARWPSLEP